MVTVGRSDYGIYRSLLRALQADPDVDLRLYVTGMHLSPEFGFTVKMIEEDGFPIAERIESLLASDSPEGLGKAMGLGLLGFSQAFSRSRPDFLVVLGDRFDMYPAAVAALPFGIPVAHIHGGEVSSGAIDDALRHSITKLSHLHFVSNAVHAARVSQLGEEPWRITISGAPALDDLDQVPRVSAAEIEKRFSLSLAGGPLLVTFHPVTTEYGQTREQIADLLAALQDVDRPVIFSAPNADTEGRIIRAAIESYVTDHENAWLVENFGQTYYYSVLAHVGALVGNSSSGIIEAGSFGLPVVNIGNRQTGRVRGANVIDVGGGRENIAAAVRRALTPEFRNSIQAAPNPYRPTGKAAAEVIVERLKAEPVNQRLLTKRFHDLDQKNC